MATDKELVDALLAHGIIQRGMFEAPDGTVLYYLAGHTQGGVPIQEIVNEWRVAGAGMEKCKEKRDQIDVFYSQQYILDMKKAGNSDCMPRTIIEACMAVLP